MANWSETYINVYSNNKTAITTFNYFLETYNENDWIGNWQLEVSNISNTDASTTIQGAGRWGLVYEPLVKIIETLELSAIIIDFEAGSDFYLELEFEKGINTVSTNDRYWCEARLNREDPQHIIDSLDGWFWEEKELDPDIVYLLIICNIMTAEEIENYHKQIVAS